MPVGGQTVRVKMVAAAEKDAEDFELVVPSHADIRNGRVSRAGNWTTRPGYEPAWTVTRKKSIIGLYSHRSTLYAQTEDGYLWWLGPQAATRELGYVGTDRAHFADFLDKTYLAAGSGIYSVTSQSLRRVTASPGGARFLTVAGDRLVTASGDNEIWYFSEAGNADTWLDNGAQTLDRQGSKVTGLVTKRGRLVVFGERHSEVWDHTAQTLAGVPLIFTRSFFIERGLFFPDTLVNIPMFETHAWMAEDEDFYQLLGTAATTISEQYRREIARIGEGVGFANAYGLDFRDEAVVRWFHPESGSTLVYDYLNKNWSQDNAYRHGQWQRLPIASATIHGGKTYVGSYEPDGQIHRWSFEIEDDDGDPIRLYRRFTIPLSGRGIAMRVNRLRFRVRRTAADATEQFVVRTRLDRAEWETHHLSLGTAGDADPHEAVIDQLGVGRELEVELFQGSREELLVDNVFLTLRAMGR